MQLRKVANHPLMIRTQFTHDKLVAIAKQLQSRAKEWTGEAVPHIVEELAAYSDFQLHELCLSHSYLKEYRLSNGE
jgi:SWI/SNF-related matrix-associated actin-dependent regulator 1 of chromatin subfamily A